ncbi:hypothetical protein ACFQ08_00360 [Streptosporangium algeriense]|uniref:Uncharacterized protein n=1 Tax=Streptosporangium algeriense TaxID=1682748 RepID=A0ABW3DJ53_9ACTN
MWNDLVGHEPTGQILTVWIAKKELRALLACAREQTPRSVISHRLIKDTARVAFGFRSLDNQRRRVRLACTHQTINPAA